MLPQVQIDEIAHINGLTREKTMAYLALVGDKPDRDDTGKVVVLDPEGKVLTRLQWPEPEME